MINPLEQLPGRDPQPVIVPESDNDFCGCVKTPGTSQGGSETFLGLLDTPKTYVGQIGKTLIVNEDGTGLVFTTLPANLNIYNSDGTLTENRHVNTGEFGLSIQGEDTGSLYAQFSDSSFGGTLYVGSNEVSLTYSNNSTGAIQYLTFNPTDGIVLRDNINQLGLVNYGDYEANFVARSLVTKQYVESKISSYSFSNGLTNDGVGNITLGGTIDRDTVIDFRSNSLYFGDAETQTGFFYIDSGGHTISTGVGNGIDTSCILNLGLNDSAGQISSFSPMGSSTIHFDDSSASLDVNGSNGSVALVLTNNGIVITNTLTNGTGVEYSGDYESNFVARSLITKQFVTQEYIPYTGAIADFTTKHKVSFESTVTSLTTHSFIDPGDGGYLWLIDEITGDVTEFQGNRIYDFNNGSRIPYLKQGEAVPYTGANQTVDIGTNILISGQVVAQSIVDNTSTSITPTNVMIFDGTSYMNLTKNRISFNNGTYEQYILPSSINTGSTTINLPSTSGTLALVTDLVGYLPLTGGTLTGDVQQTVGPVNANSLITRSYVDNLLTGLTWKKEVRAATTVNITLSGTQTVDGIALIAGDRILVKNQTTASQNGIYAIATGAWARTPDADTTEEIEGATVMVRLGTVNKDTQWTNTNNNEPVIGTDPITFGQISGAGTYTNGTGILLSANVFSLDTSYTDGLYIHSTLAGYGITDAVNTFGGQNISGAKTFTWPSTTVNTLFVTTQASPTTSSTAAIGLSNSTAESNFLQIGMPNGVALVKIGSSTTNSNWKLDGAPSAGTRSYILPNSSGTLALVTDIPTSYVASITGTANQVIASASTGAITLSLPQDIATTSTPQFSKLSLGGAISTTANFFNQKVITGGTTAYANFTNGAVQSDVTANAYGYLSSLSISSTTTVTSLFNYAVVPGTIASGGSIGTQTGYYVAPTMTGATTNYAFRSAIAVGTNRWNLYMDGTAANYLAGQTSIGSTSLTIAGLYVAVPGVGTTLVRGTSLTQALAAAANGGSTIALDIAPTFTNPGTGVLSTSTLVGGSGYAPGNYTGVMLTGGTGTGVSASIAVSAGGIVTSVTITTLPGTGYTIGDVLSANPSFDGVGAGSGFSITVATVGFTNITNYAIRSTGTGWTQLGGNIGFGTTPSASITFTSARPITGSTTAFGFRLSNAIQSDVTGAATIISSEPSTQAASFNLGALSHFAAIQSTIGAGSTITTQYGFQASNLTGATNNMAFRGGITVATGRWNLYMDGTAQNYLNGSLGIGVGQTTPTSLLQVGGSRTLAAWGTTGSIFSTNIGTYTDNSTAASTTVTNAMANSFATPTFAATNTLVTYTNAATVYINNAPTAFTNVTITNPYALFVNAGKSHFGGDIEATLQAYSSGSMLNVIYNTTNKRFETNGASMSGTTMSLSTNTTLTAANFGPSGHLTIYATATAAFTITLPAASTWGSSGASLINYVLYVVKVDGSAFTVTVKGNGSELINAANSDTSLSTQYTSNTYQSNGTQVYKF